MDRKYGHMAEGTDSQPRLKPGALTSLLTLGVLSRSAPSPAGRSGVFPGQRVVMAASLPNSGGRLSLGCCGQTAVAGVHTDMRRGQESPARKIHIRSCIREAGWIDRRERPSASAWCCLVGRRLRLTPSRPDLKIEVRLARAWAILELDGRLGCAKRWGMRRAGNTRARGAAA